MASPGQKYQPLTDSPVTDIDQFSIGVPVRSSFSFATIFPWILTAMFASLSLFQYVKSIGSYSLGTFQTGFKTEFFDIKSRIQVEPVQFWGGPRWHDNGSFYKLQDPNSPKYVGLPSEEIDQAWEGLVKGRYFAVTEEEAIAMWGKDHGLSDNPEMGYSIGLDVHHTLHCVNELRMALDKDHYFVGGHKLPDRGHRDHCLDQIRQMLMCHADLTPIPVIWYPGHGRDFTQSDVVHTCRNWDAIEEYIQERANFTKEVLHRNHGRPDTRPRLGTS